MQVYLRARPNVEPTLRLVGEDGKPETLQVRVSADGTQAVATDTDGNVIESIRPNVLKRLDGTIERTLTMDVDVDAIEVRLDLAAIEEDEE